MFINKHIYDVALRQSLAYGAIVEGKEEEERRRALTLTLTSQVTWPPERASFRERTYGPPPRKEGNSLCNKVGMD